MSGSDRNVAVNLIGRDKGVTRMFATASAEAGKLHTRLGVVSSSLTTMAGLVAAKELAGGLLESAKAAGDFQSQVLHLTTDAGELHKNIGMVTDGILKLAVQTGTATKDLVNGMYYIESAGFHGAAALNVLKNAAEGAKVGAADLTTVSNALTTALVAYRMPATGATAVTNELIATVSRGKMKLEDLASSLGTVLPAAATAKIGLDQVLGAMATMTAEGIAPANAATYLRQTILQLENPTAKAAKEMQGLGLSAIDVSKNLGQRGLTGTFTLLTDAIEKKMGPQGVVLIESLKKAAKNTSDFQKILANLPPTQQTYVAALANMVGGTKSMQAALALTGQNAQTFAANVKAIGSAAKDTAHGVKDWDVIQQSFNQKLSEAKSAVEVLKIKLGNALLPVLTKLLDEFTNRGVPMLTKFGQQIAHSLPAISMFAQSLGGPVLTALKALAPMFHGNITSVLAFAASFKLVTPAIRAMQEQVTSVGKSGGIKAALTSALKGGLSPWNLAIVAGTAFLGHWITKQIEAKQRIADLTAALQADNGALGANTRATVANALEKDGTLKLAQKYGLTLSQVTDAALGNKAAQEVLNATLNAQHKALEQVIYDSAPQSRARQQAIHDITELESAQKKLNAAVGTENTALQAGLAQSKRIAAATRASTAAHKALAQSYDESSTSIAGQIDRLRTEHAALKALPALKAVNISTPGLDKAIFDLQVLRANIAALQDKTVTIRGVVIDNTSGIANAGRGPIPGHATGGTLNAGWNLVGEQGAELVNGSTGQVLTASQSRHALGGNTYVVNVNGFVGDKAALVRAIRDELIKQTRRGGATALA